MPSPTKRLIPHGIDLSNLPIDAITIIDDISVAPLRIAGFNSKLRLLPNQPSFFISNESWKKLVNGENSGGKWLNEDEEVHGFIFCIAFPREIPIPIHGGEISIHKHAYFRIRTIVKSNKKFIKVHGIDSDTLHIPEMEILNIFPIQIEQNNIAYVDIDEALKNIPNNDCLKFANYTSGREINIDVTNFKSNVRSFFKEPFPIANYDEIKNKLNKKPISQLKIQQGTIFSSKCDFFKNLNNKDVKGMRISFGWDKESQSFTYIIQINPTGEINGIKCPVPETACN